MTCSISPSVDELFSVMNLKLHASSASQTTRSSWVMEFDGPKHKRSRHYFDMLSFMKQLGVIE